MSRFLILLCVFLYSFPGYSQDISTLTLGREFSAVAYPRITPKMVLNEIRKVRGGSIYKHAQKPRKWVLKDDEGKKWGVETDGKLPDGRLVLEAQTPPLALGDTALMSMPLEAMLKIGATPMYSVGGGHIHIDVKRYFQKYPFQFASLINFLLNYEETLDFMFGNPRRMHTIRRLSSIRIPGTSKTLPEYIGEKLNRYIKANDKGCERDSELERYYAIHKSCIVAALEHFAREIVPGREMDINLQAWKGTSFIKTHGTLELRFFNAPKMVIETVLEEKLVRAIARHAADGDYRAVYYKPVVSPAVGENAYTDREKLKQDFVKMLVELDLDPRPYIKTYFERLSDRRNPGA